MAEFRENRAAAEGLLTLLLLEDGDAADCGQGSRGHPAQAVNYLLELLADPDCPALTIHCPQCQRQPEFEPGFYQGNPAVREIPSDGKALIYMLHPELVKSLVKGLKIQEQSPQ